MRIAVAGGTGTVGTHVVEVARERGHDVVVLSRSNGVDLLDGAGVEDALSGSAAVIDVTSVQTRSADESRHFFGTVTRHVLDAGAAAGVGHHILLGIVGSIEAPYDYYAGKAMQEELVEHGPLPWTILRATQFHEFAQQIHGTIRVGPIDLAPAMRSQPIAAREVAERVIELAEGPAAAHVADLGGPREERMASMVRRYARAIGSRRPVLEVPAPGAFGRALRSDILLPKAGATLGRQTFDEWLAALRT